MINKEEIQKSELLKELPEDVLNEVVKVSNTATQTEVDKALLVQKTKTDEMWAKLGYPKENGIKSYEHTENMFKKKLEEIANLKAFEETNKTLSDKIEQLQSQLKDGKGNEALKQQIKDLEDQFVSKEEKYKTDYEELQSKYKEEETRNIKLWTQSQFSDGMKGLTFNGALNEEDRETILNSKLNQTTAELKPEFIDDRGVKVLAWRDKEGTILRDKENGSKPMGIFDIVKNQHNLSGVFDFGKKAEGLGEKGAKGKPSGVIDISGATTQVQADEIIVSNLMAKGIARTDKRFQPKFSEMRAKAKVQELPLH